MELLLFATFLVLSLVLIGLGLYFREHSELSLVGFAFLFLLSMILLTGTITQKTGFQSNTTCVYEGGNLTSTIETSSDIYEAVNFDGSSAHRFGYYLAAISVLGFAGVLIGIRRSKKHE